MRALSASTLMLTIVIAAAPAGVSVAQRAPGPDKAAVEKALAAAEARWKVNRPKAYEFSVHLWCDCPASRAAPVRFQVSGDTSRPVKKLSTELERAYRSYQTIDDVFASIRNNLSWMWPLRPVKFDDKLGFPESADLNSHFAVRVTNFKTID